MRVPSPSARSLILDLLSTLRRGSMPAAALVEAGALFRIREGSIRVALARLRADGRIERDARGRYRLGPAAAAVKRRIGSWRQRPRATRAWNGHWIAVHLPAGSERGARRSRERILRFLGFQPLEPALRIRPDNLCGGCERTRAALLELGLDPAAWVGELRGLDPETQARACGLWDVAALDAAYRASRAMLEASARRLPGLPSRRAMVESFRLGGRAIQQLVRDPLLPPEILPGDSGDALFASLQRYDRLGRRCWADFLAAHDVPHLSAPVDSRLPGHPIPEVA